MPALEVLASRYMSEGVVQRAVIGEMATVPDGSTPFLTLQSYPGGPPNGTLSAPTKYRQVLFQVTARAKSYPAADAAARAAYNASVISNATVGGMRFLRVRPLQEPFELPPDTAGRVRVAFNVIAVHAE